MSEQAITPAPPVDEVELEELEESDTVTMVVPSRAPSVVPGPRSSMPPPIPEVARQSRSLPPPGAAKSSLPAPPPPARTSVPPSVPPPRSGMFRIESVRKGSSAPPIPARAIRDAHALSSELEQERTQVQRLRLQLRMRDDRVLDLERLVDDLRSRVERAERQLEQERRHVPDDLKRIRGIGPGFERKLHAAGIKTFAQVAAWTLADIERIAQELSIVPQRIVRDGWVERARELASAP